MGDDERGEVDDFRAQLLRQFLGGQEPSADDSDPVASLLKTAGVPVAPPVSQATELMAGQLLVANPERFCSRNPFSRPVRDLGRFGLQGPIDLGEMDADFAAQMLPVRASHRGDPNPLCACRLTRPLIGRVPTHAPPLPIRCSS